MRANPLIEIAALNFLLYADASIPNDPHFNEYPDDPNQWGFYKIQAPQAWDIERGSPEVLIAILDSGIPLDDNGNLCHPDLDDPNKFILGPDLTETFPWPKDDRYHGIHVTGIAAAETEILAEGQTWRRDQLRKPFSNQRSLMLMKMMLFCARQQETIGKQLSIIQLPLPLRVTPMSSL